MSKKINIAHIQGRREYSYREVASLFGIHIRTVQSWRKKGLNILEGTARPVLVLGVELKKFLRERQNKNKRTLKADEFYCTRCNKPRKSILNERIVESTGKYMGIGNKQLRIKGKCNVCSCRLSRLTSEKQLSKIGDIVMKNSHPDRILIDDKNSHLNTDIEVSVNEQV